MMLARAALLLAVASGTTFAADIPGPVADDPVSSHPEQVLVRFTPDATGQAMSAAQKRAGVDGVVYSYQLVPNLFCLHVPAGTVEAAISSLRTDPSVMYAEPDYDVHTMSQSVPYGTSMVNAPTVWAGSTAPGHKGAGAKIAILDTGVDLTHPDLPVPVAMTSFISGQAVDDYHTHGTHCSGIALARDNTIGIVGCAPEASLMTGKVLGNEGYGSDSGVLAGVNWAWANGANVISMSLGGGGYSQAFSDTCDAAFAHNVVIAAAAGNSASSTPSWPGSYNSVICVAAVDSTGAQASFSNFGPTIDIAAPGVNNLSTIPVISTNVTWSGVGHAGAMIAGSTLGSATGNAVFCGLGLTAADFPPTVAGNIAHIRRGTGTFQLKTDNAVAAGAVGVIISNNAGGVFSGTTNSGYNIPVIAISQTDGDTLQAASGVSTSIVTSQTGHDYASYSGTSMSTPHVAGVAGLLIGLYGPGHLTAAQVREALENSATDLGAPGRDDTFGWGLVNAAAAKTYIDTHFACVADMDDGSGTGTRDGGVTIDDLLYFLARFSAGNLAADVDDGSGTGVHDSGVTIDDLLYFLARFSAGC